MNNPRFATHLTIALVFSCPLLSDAQVFRNGNFDRGVEGWGWSQQKSARGEFTVVPSDSPSGGNVAQVVVTATGPAHRLQLTHDFTNSSLPTDKAYQLRFLARASEQTSFQVLLMNRNKPWGNLGLSRTVAVDTQWKEFRFAFRRRASEQEYGKVNFFLGQLQDTLWLDGVTIEPYDPQAIHPDGPELNTDRWGLQFTKTGAIARLVHKPTGCTLIEPSDNRSAYRLTLLRNGVRSVVPGEQATSVRCETLTDAQGYRFVANHPCGKVTLDYRVDPATGLLECRSNVENKTDAAITAIEFPIIHAPEMLGEASEDDVLLYPLLDGAVIDDPRATLRDGKSSMSHAYPGGLSCQVMAYCDPTAGLYIASHDPDGYAKQFTVESLFQIRLSLNHLAPSIDGQDLKRTYPVVIGPFAGDPQRDGTCWQDAAEIYRGWSQEQKWAERKVRTRQDTPDWLRDGAMVTFYNPRQLTPPGDQSRLEAFLQDYNDRFNIPLLPNNRGFERYGTWCGQEYLPAMPDEATFRGSAVLTKRLGGRSMVMLSGYRWTIERTTPEGEEYNSRERFMRDVAPWTVHDPGGQPLLASSSKPDDYHGRQWSRMCRATDFSKQTIVDLSKYFVANGYSVIHFDQECSGAYSDSVCWSTAHGHPPGDGRWVHLAMADLYQQICDACRPLDADFMLSMEEPNELYLPWLNLCQARPFGITPEWPVVPPATRSVPLFQYLYHENLVGWAAFYPWKSAGRPCYSLAKGFTIGQMPGLVPPQNLRFSSPPQGDQFLTLLSRCITGYRTFAHDYLVWGRMERPLTMVLPQRRFPWNGDGRGERELAVPAVSHEVWSLEDGRIGIVFVNPETQAHNIDLDLSPLIADGQSFRIREVSTQGDAREHTSSKIRQKLPALDMLLLELLPKRKTADQ